MQSKPYSIFKLAVKYLRYYFTASNSKGHGMHSPFVYSLIREVLNDRRRYYAYDSIEALRCKLLNNHNSIELEDHGAGGGVTRQERISVITKRTSKSPKLGKLLFRLTNFFQPATVLELGTSMGISGAYLAAGHHPAKLYTLEGAPEVASIASENFRQLELNSCHVITGNFDETLGPLLRKLEQLDFAYIDGNHRLEPTMRYFNQLLPFIHENSVLVFDDIHWSEEMEAAWGAIRSSAATRCTVDLFFIGLVFFSSSFKEPQHFTIRF